METNSNEAKQQEDIQGRAQGCLLGQLAGDALGSLVEFQTPEEIRREYPVGVRELETPHAISDRALHECHVLKLS